MLKFCHGSNIQAFLAPHPFLFLLILCCLQAWRGASVFSWVISLPPEL